MDPQVLQFLDDAKTTSYIAGIQVELMWKRPKGLASILFSRYFSAMILGAFVGGSAIVVTTVDLVLFLRFVLGFVMVGSIRDMPKLSSFIATAPLIVSFIMFIMTLYKCLPQAWGGDQFIQRTAMSLFLRDGIMWFIAVLAIMISHMIVEHTRVTLGYMMML
ncbi:hypothetical protein WG66_011612 [Moniliophthora roreri]|nr:hypothetical protein WG66_011612 [Moniliophthora roreri]